MDTETGRFNFDWSRERERLQYIQRSKKVQNNAQEEEAKTNKLMKKSLSYGMNKLKDSSSFAGSITF